MAGMGWHGEPPGGPDVTLKAASSLLVWFPHPQSNLLCRVNEVTGPSAQSPTQAPSESAPESRLLPTPPPAPPRPQEGSVGLTQGIGVTFGLSEV